MFRLKLSDFDYKHFEIENDLVKFVVIMSSDPDHNNILA